MGLARMGRQEFRLVLGVTFLFCLLVGAWCVDISVSAMNMGGILTNGNFVVEPVKAYHYGLYTVLLSGFFLTLLVIRCVMVPVPPMPFRNAR